MNGVTKKMNYDSIKEARQINSIAIFTCILNVLFTVLKMYLSDFRLQDQRQAKYLLYRLIF